MDTHAAAAPEPNDDQGPLIERVAIACMCLSGLAVVLRIVSRKLVKQPLLWDDWLILTAIPFSWAVPILMIRGVHIGAYGKHIKHVDPHKIPIFFMLLYALQFCYLFSITFVKLSLLLFYRRIFSIPQTRWPALIIGGTVVVWGIASLPPAIWACKPLYGFWQRSIHPECLDPSRYYLGITIPNILTDAALLVFPIPLIWKLRIAWSSKVPLLGVFLLAGFVIVVSALRLEVLTKSQGDPDVTFALVPIGIWSMVETNIGVLLTCLPSMLPILRLLLGKPAKASNVADSSPPSNAFKARKLWPGNWKSTTSDRSFSPLNELHSEAERYGQMVAVYRSQSDEMSKASAVTESQGIYVKQDIEWTQSRQ